MLAQAIGSAASTYVASYYQSVQNSMRSSHLTQHGCTGSAPTTTGVFFFFFESNCTLLNCVPRYTIDCQPKPGSVVLQCTIKRSGPQRINATRAAVNGAGLMCALGPSHTTTVVAFILPGPCMYYMRPTGAAGNNSLHPCPSIEVAVDKR